MKKALLIRLSSLGDVIFNLPLCNVIKNNGYEVTWLVSEKGIDIVKDNPAVHKTILFPIQKWKKQGFCFKTVKEIISFIKEIRKEKYDIALDTQMMFRSFLCMKLCRAKRKIVSAYGRELSTFGGKEKVPILFKPDLSVHVLDLRMEFARYLQLDGTDKFEFSLPPSPPETINKINELLQDIDRSKPLVIICPATTWHLKHWNKDNWVKLIDAIKDKCTLVFSGMEKDKELISYISKDKYLNLAGKTNIKDMIELFKRADIVISPDSGSAHTARAVEIPAVISIFCCTPPLMYGPKGDDKKYFAVGGGAPNCLSCHLRKCPLTGEDFENCINFPEPEKIINIVNNLLQNIKNSV